MANKKKPVVLVLDDQDYHGMGCDCGRCNRNGKTYGVAIFKRGEEDGGDPVDRVYGPSEGAALNSARAVAKKLGFAVARRVGGKKRHGYKLVSARKGTVLDRARADSPAKALRKYRAKGHGTTGVTAVRYGGKKRHATSKDERLLAGMRNLGVKWKKGRALPTYKARMTQAQKLKADKLYDQMSEGFIDEMGVTKLAAQVKALLK